jgi:hypothetical protein
MELSMEATDGRLEKLLAAIPFRGSIDDAA